MRRVVLSGPRSGLALSSTLNIPDPETPLGEVLLIPELLVFPIEIRPELLMPSGRDEFNEFKSSLPLAEEEFMRGVSFCIKPIAFGIKDWGLRVTQI